MRVHRADAMGMCFGVKDALEKVMGLENPGDAVLYGELVHNQEVGERLRARGFAAMGESARSVDFPQGQVVITAHGVSDRERRRLEEAGKTLVDTTCPLVKRVHTLARGLQAQGYFLVVIGRKDHVEVRGITGDLERFAVVEKPEDVEIYPAEKIGVVCQTTTPPALMGRLFQKIARKNFGKEIRMVNTICRPTRERQEAVEGLLRRVEALVVVGGRHSNNTRQLAALAVEAGVPCFHVERACELRPGWFAGFSTLGLTAGTSTLDETIEEVYQALVSMEVPHGSPVRQ